MYIRFLKNTYPIALAIRVLFKTFLKEIYPQLFHNNSHNESGYH